jgi:hypothetical protein
MALLLAGAQHAVFDGYLSGCCYALHLSAGFIVAA